MLRHDADMRNLKSDRQKEMTYILYMFMGSYFKKCVCKSMFMEKHLFLYYKEMSRNKQVITEERVVRTIDRLLEREGIDFSDLNCEALILNSGSDYLILYRTWFENVLITVKNDGRYHIEFFKEGGR